MILIGYQSSSGYTLLDVTNKRFVISRDIVVDEIIEMHQPITSYIKVVTSYNFENSDFADIALKIQIHILSILPFGNIVLLRCMRWYNLMYNQFFITKPINVF